MKERWSRRIKWEDYEMPPKENDRLTDQQIEIGSQVDRKGSSLAR